MTKTMNETTILYRPVGPEELALIEQSGFSAFPPRLPEQPIFYPVTNEAYAEQIARDWNVKASGAGFVTRFAVRSDFLSAYIENAVLSAQVTHAHPEAVAGTIAVSVGAALAYQMRNGNVPTRADFIDAILPDIPPSLVREKCRIARDLSEGGSVRLAVAALGNGTGVSAQDTVPFCLWCAGEKLDNYEEALWLTVSGLGDRDTNCAIVGGIVALFAGRPSIPALWQENREPLPRWFL